MRPFINTFFVMCVAVTCASAVLAQDNPQSAIYTLEKTVNAGTATRADQLNLARAYIAVGRYYEASKIAKHLLDIDSNDAESATIRDEAAKGMRTIAQQKLASAEAAAKAKGATDEDRLVLANAYFEAGDYRGAAETFAKLPDPMKTREMRLRQARALAWSSQQDAAERAYAGLLAEERTPELELEYGRVLSWMGASRAAQESLKTVYERDRTEGAAIALANAQAWGGNREGAIQLLNEFTASHAGAMQARQLLSELQASPDLRLERVEKVIEAEPYNLALHYERARLLYDAGRYAQALNEIKFVREHSKDAVQGLDELAAQAEQRRKEEVAKLDERRRALGSMKSMTSGSDNGQADELLNLAKAYTALSSYDQAIDLYEHYLQMRPDDMNARINYARVLNWDRRYDSSARQYEKLVAARPDRADLRYEYAQVLSYQSDYVDAIRTLRDLTDISDNPRANLYSDVPQKAYFNLGQIYRWYGWNDTAIEQQNRAIAIDPNYGPARQELMLARYQRPASTLGLTYGFAEDSNDFTFRRIDLDAQKWLSQRLAVDGIIGRHNFERRGNDIGATAASGGVRYRFQDRLTGRARAGANFYDSGLGVRPFFGAGLDWLPNLQTRTAIDYNHYDLVYDVFNLSALGPTSQIPNAGDPLGIDDFRGRLDYRSGGFWSALGDASYGFISDDNKRAAAHGLLSFRVFKSPFVAIKADGRYLSYDRRSSRYWSPTQYHSLAGVLQIGQDVRGKFYWTAEAKIGRAYEQSRTSDIRAYQANVIVPVSDTFDVVGSYGYGKSGRFDNFVGSGNGDFTNYWQRNFYVGVRMKRLFTSSEDPRRGDRYYYDNRVLTGSPVIPPVGEIQ